MITKRAACLAFTAACLTGIATLPVSFFGSSFVWASAECASAAVSTRAQSNLVMRGPFQKRLADACDSRGWRAPQAQSAAGMGPSSARLFAPLGRACMPGLPPMGAP